MGGSVLMQWCCEQAKHSKNLDCYFNLKRFVIYGDESENIKEEEVFYCPFCGKRLAELLH